jgi:hypothetical protein
MNLRCVSREDWNQLIMNVFPKERDRFSIPDAYDQTLIDQSQWPGKPLLLAVGEVLIHVYPPLGRQYPGLDVKPGEPPIK